MRVEDTKAIPIGQDFPGWRLMPDGRKCFGRRAARAWVRIRILPSNELKTIRLSEFLRFEKARGRPMPPPEPEEAFAIGSAKPSTRQPAGRKARETAPMQRGRFDWSFHRAGITVRGQEDADGYVEVLVNGSTVWRAVAP